MLDIFRNLLSGVSRGISTAIKKLNLPTADQFSKAVLRNAYEQSAASSIKGALLAGRTFKGEMANQARDFKAGSAISPMQMQQMNVPQPSAPPPQQPQPVQVARPPVTRG